MKRQLKYSFSIYKVIQMILGMLFVVSGFVKGIDPVGVSYKLFEYFQLFGLEFLERWALGFVVLLCATEIFIGLLLISGVFRKISSLLTLLFLSMFTIVTFYLFVSPSVEITECGCFGDAFKLSNGETFFKNIFFTILAFLYFRRQWMTNTVLSPPGNRSISIVVILYTTVISIFIPLYSIIYLPPFDFLPFNRGVNILDNINLKTNESRDIYVIYKNRENGETKKIDLNDSTWRDSDTWEYVNMDVPEVRHQDYLSKFVVIDGDGVDCSSMVFDDSDFNFIIIARNIDNLRDEDFRKITPLDQLSRDGVINLYLFTSSELDKAGEKLSSHGLSMIKTYNVDEVVLKSMIRNDRGVMLVSGGVITGKWNLKRDSFRDLSKSNLEQLKRREKHILANYWITISSSVLVLMVLVVVRKYFKTKRKEYGIKES